MARESVYDDEPSAEELKLLEEHERKAGVPEPDDSSQAPAPAAAEPGADADDDELDEDEDSEPKPKPAAQPEPKGEEGDDEPGDDEGKAPLAAFLEKHKGKTPEQLVQLAFQQQQRANKAEFDQRKTSENLNTVLSRIQAARDARVNKTAEERAAFEKKLAEDPDAALAEERDARLRSEEARDLQALDAEEFEARATAAIELASAAIPEFAKRAPAIRGFGVELGFSPEEVGGIVDGRQIVALHLASIAGNMIKAGIIDTAGRFIGLPEPVAGEEGQDPQPAPRRGSGFGRQPARGSQGAKTLEQRLNDVANMSEEDFAKLDEKELAALLQEVDQQ
jgi:hypothetical protein